jgi:hypothetical protein
MNVCSLKYVPLTQGRQKFGGGVEGSRTHYFPNFKR